MQGKDRIGIALSGGGYRAAGFHLGTLKKLSELGILAKVDVLSTISGGSITGAAYCLHQGDIKAFVEEMITTLTTKSVIRYVLTSWLFIRALIFCLLFLCLSRWLYIQWAPLGVISIFAFIFLLIRYQFKILPVSRIIEKAYNNFFYHEATLSGLCEQPELAIGSTNLQTSRHFTFSKRKMEDSTYAYYKPPVLFNCADFPVARAVMASSCVPFAFTPVSVDAMYYCDPALATTVDPKLVDGGVYDNQGIHKITQDNSSYACQLVVVSDAGNLLPFEKAYNNTFTLLLRTVDTFMARIKNFQMMQNIYQVPNKREIAYLSLGWDLENCLPGFYDNLKTGNIAPVVLAAHQLPEDWIKAPALHKDQITQYMEQRCQVQEILAKALPKDRLQKIRQIATNLTRIKRELVQDMIIHAANLTELQIRLYCPSLIPKLNDN
jgi:NTE family protein